MYSYPAEGFEVAFPQKPLEFRTKMGSDEGYAISYKAIVVNPIPQYTVLVVHERKRVLKDAVIERYPEGAVRGIMKGLDVAVLEFIRKIKFHGFPAIEYKFTYKIEEAPVVCRGIVLIVDGEPYALSQVFAVGDPDAERNFQRFIGSFRLLPIEGALSKHRFDDLPRNISFSLPEGWERGRPKYARVIAKFSNPAGHSITVLDDDDPSYTCDHYKREAHAMRGVVQGTGETAARGRTLFWLKHTGYNAAAGIRMTSAHYCVDTAKGAVVMVGTAPEQTFFRSEILFRKTALSMEVRK